MRRYLALTLACVLASVSVSALALGLGEIRLNSHLNQRLDAEIELVSAAADELESLKVSLADHNAYARYGLDRSPILNTLQFRVVRRPNGTAYLSVTSSESIKEPFLTFLVEASWSRGRLLREYTVLLDPPTFAGREEAAAEEAFAQSPTVTPERQMPAEAPVAEAVRPEPRRQERVEQPMTAETRTVEETSGDIISIPSLDAEEDVADAYQPQSTARFAAEPETAGNYGPIQRNETLWGIAMRLRPDESITINQMMIALYRANPEAFQGNINRLKAGYILRIPEYAEIRGISRTDAFREARQHNEDWELARSGGPVERTQPVEAPAVEREPELSLVAPADESLEFSELDAGGEADEAGIAAGHDADLALEDAGESAMDLGIDAESPDRLLEIQDEALQALQAQDEIAAGDETAAPPLPDDLEFETEEPFDEQAGEAVADVVDEASVDEPVETQPVADAVQPVAPRRPEPGLVDQLLALMLSPLGMGIGAAVLVLLLAGALVMRKRREAGRASAASVIEWDDEEGSDVTVVAGAVDEADTAEATIAGAFAHDFGDEDTGTTRLEDDAKATQLLKDADSTQMISPVESDNKSFEDTMVGGQAVTLDDNDPLSEADFHMAYGLYDQAAEVVQKAVDRDPSRKEWHAKLAEIHFAGNNVEGFLAAARKLKELVGPDDADWNNVAIMGSQIAADDPLFAEGGSTSAVDLDFGSAAEEFDGGETLVNESASEPAVPAGDSGGDLDFDISLDSPSEDAEAEAEAPVEEVATSTADDGGLDFDLDLGDITPQTDAPAEPVAEPADGGGDFDFDLGDLGSDFGNAADAAVEDAGSPGDAFGDSAGDSLDDSSVTSTGDEETQTEFDKALQELSAYVDTNLPEQDAGDAVDDGQGDELNLDEYSFDQPGDDFGDETSEGTGEDEDDIGEIGTKLDLARAYIDMGDPDGARGILDEVLADGDDEQKKEARDLLEQLG